MADSSEEKKDLNIMVCPISGGCFPVQIASCMRLCDEGTYKPDVVFASSGGNICTLLMEATGWTSDRVFLMSEYINGNMFARRWSVPILDRVYGMWKGSVMTSGEGVRQYIAGILDEKLLKTEVWLGVYNEKTRKPIAVCTQFPGNTIMTLDDMDKLCGQMEDPIYCCRDVGKVTDYAIASCSIPGYVPSVEVGGLRLADGGCVAASPMTLFFSKTKELATCGKNNVHFALLTCGEMEDSSNQCKGEWSDEERSDSSGNLVRSYIDICTQMLNRSVLRERTYVLSIISSMGLALKATFLVKVTQESMKHFSNYKKDYSATMVEIFSRDTKALDLGNFTGKQCLLATKEAYDKSTMRVFHFCSGKCKTSHSLKWLYRNSIQRKSRDECRCFS